MSAVVATFLVPSLAVKCDHVVDALLSELPGHLPLEVNIAPFGLFSAVQLPPAT
jgi:hypothetical protein